MWRYWKDGEKHFSHILHRECGTEGNCQMLSLVEVLKPLRTVTHHKLRSLAASECLKLSTQEYNMWMHRYQEKYDSGEMEIMWNPGDIVSRTQLAEQIERPLTSGNGYDFEGDAFTLYLLSKNLAIKIFVVN